MQKLIYIDDDPDALELYCDILEGDFDVTPCQDPKKALDLLLRDTFDVILLDIYLPGTNGFEIYEKIKSMPQARKTPVFFISSENSLDNKIKAFGLGSDDFIDRNMPPEEVTVRIKSRLQKKLEQQDQPQILEFGDIVINQDELTVTVGGELKELTQIEYKLLFYLIKEAYNHPGQAVDRSEIIDFVWPLNPEKVFPRTLSTHFTNLRKKLGSKRVKLTSARQQGFYLKLV